MDLFMARMEQGLHQEKPIMDKHGNTWGDHLEEYRWYVNDQGIHKTKLKYFLEMGDEEIPNFDSFEAAVGFAISAICARLSDVENKAEYNSDKARWRRIKQDHDEQMKTLWKSLEEDYKDLTGDRSTEV
jgi:hypothetical protein